MGRFLRGWAMQRRRDSVVAMMWGSSLVEKRKRGRPRKPVYGEIVRALTAADIALWQAKRAAAAKRAGRKPNRARNRSLLKGYRVAMREDRSLRSFAKKFFVQERGRTPTPDELRVLERQIARLRKKNFQMEF